MYFLVVFGAVNTQGFVWVSFYALYKKIIHSFIDNRRKRKKETDLVRLNFQQFGSSYTRHFHADEKQGRHQGTSNRSVISSSFSNVSMKVKA